MSRQVPLELSDEVLSRAERLAMLTRRDVRDVLADAVTAVLPPVDIVLGDSRPVADLLDGEVLKLTALRLSSEQDRKLGQLLDHQQAGQLTEAERAELLTLRQVDEATLLRQAEALAEAVQRGLRDPLSP